jgi:hypothetical protein
VGTGATASAVNASVTPALPAGLADGDLLLILASIRNADSTGVVNKPDNWVKIRESGGVCILGRFYQSGVLAQQINFTGGVANADTMARCIAVRGVSPDALAQSVTNSATNVSAQNIGYPALDVPSAGCFLFMGLWKQDDATSITPPAGWTGIGTTSVTAGDDALQALYYQVQTTESDIGSGSVTVTGGASAISKALLVALKPAAAIVVNAQNVWPPRNQIVLTGLTIGDSVAVYRVVDGQRTALRGPVDAVTDTAYVVIDAEQPFGVPVSYVAVVAGTAEYATADVTYTLPGGKIALSDAISGLAAEVLVGADGGKAYGRDSARLRVAGRNVVVTGPPGQATGSYELVVENTVALENLLDLLRQATQAAVLLRQAGGYDGLDAYLVVDAWTVGRFNQAGQEQKRLVTIEYAETDGWAPTLTALSFTYQDVMAAFTAPNNTYQDLMDAYPTYLALIQGDFS